jgi:drug/metabolite transporter (DMT)-like permease
MVEGALLLTAAPSITVRRMSRLQADLLLVAAAAIWGFGYLFQKTAMADVGPFTFVAARAIIAALCLAVVATFEARRAPTPMPRSLARTALVAGFLFFIAAAVQQSGMVTASVTNTGFLTALDVVTTPLMAWLVFRRTPNRVVWPAVALAFAGVWLLGGGSIGGLGLGDILVAASAIGWSAHLLVVSGAAAHGRPIAFTALQFAVVAVCAGAAALIAEPVSLAALTAAAPSILYVGVLSSAFTFAALAAALRHTPPTEAAILVSTEVLVAAFAGVVFLGDRLTPVGWAGAALMFAATLLVQAGPWLTRGKAAPEPVEPAIPPDSGPTGR